MIKAVNIHKYFGNLHVLKGVGLSIGAGEIVSIVGKSGAGKSTLLQIMGTLLPPDEGTLLIDGTDIYSLRGRALSMFRNQKIGFVSVSSSAPGVYCAGECDDACTYCKSARLP